MGQITHKKTYTKEYRTWIAMRSRCTNKNEPNYINYGARGIKVCKRWENFENFYEDMGPLPFYEAQLDRINNEGDYCKENCRWATPKENSRNRRNTKRHKTNQGQMVQQELIEKIGWTKNQYRWYQKRYGISWILEKYKTGTLPIRVNKEINREDIVDKDFGAWKVIRFLSYTKNTGHLYLCRCECGIERPVPRNNLIRGKTRLCRKCSARKNWVERKTKQNT